MLLQVSEQGLNLKYELGRKDLFIGTSPFILMISIAPAPDKRRNTKGWDTMSVVLSKPTNDTGVLGQECGENSDFKIKLYEDTDEETDQIYH